MVGEAITEVITEAITVMAILIITIMTGIIWYHTAEVKGQAIFLHTGIQAMDLPVESPGEVVQFIPILLKTGELLLMPAALQLIRAREELTQEL
jgi:hypothetical protein